MPFPSTRKASTRKRHRHKEDPVLKKKKGWKENERREPAARGRVIFCYSAKYRRNPFDLLSESPQKSFTNYLRKIYAIFTHKIRKTRYTVTSPNRQSAKKSSPIFLPSLTTQNSQTARPELDNKIAPPDRARGRNAHQGELPARVCESGRAGRAG